MRLRNKSSLPDEGRELFYGPRLFHRRHLHGIVQCECLDIYDFGEPEYAGVAPGLECRPALDVLPGNPGVIGDRVPSGDSPHDRGHGSLPDFNGPRNLTGKIKDNAAGLGDRAACLTDQDVPIRILCKRRGVAVGAGDNGAGKPRAGAGDNRGAGGLPGQKVNLGERVLIDAFRSLRVEHVRQEKQLAVLVLYDGRFGRDELPLRRCRIRVQPIAKGRLPVRFNGVPDGCGIGDDRAVFGNINARL